MSAVDDDEAAALDDDEAAPFSTFAFFSFPPSLISSFTMPGEACFGVCVVVVNNSAATEPLATGDPLSLGSGTVAEIYDATLRVLELATAVGFAAALSVIVGADFALVVIEDVAPVGAAVALVVIEPVGAAFALVVIEDVGAAFALVPTAPVGAAFGGMMNRITPGASTTEMFGTPGGASGTGGGSATLRNSSRLRFS